MLHCAFFTRVIMAYDRRNLNLYHRGGGGGAPLPSSYRNKAFLIVGATALYTAFLYHSGMSSTTGTAADGLAAPVKLIPCRYLHRRTPLLLFSLALNLLFLLFIPIFLLINQRWRWPISRKRSRRARPEPRRGRPQRHDRHGLRQAKATNRVMEHRRY
jgi:hypothetical protein